MPTDAASVSFGDFVFGESGEEAGCRPAFLVGASGEVGPESLDRRQPEIIEDQTEAGGVDRLGGGNAASPITTVPSSS